MREKQKLQMSESFFLAIVLALGGGFRDSYSFLSRGGVFANAQTGNLVLMSQGIAKHDIHYMLKYLFPVAAFVAGIYITESVKRYFKECKILHWRQLLLLIEVAMLIVVGFMPTSMNYLANVIISFSCAMQVQTFRSFHGAKMATTMCTGNLRTATELVSQYNFTRDKESLLKSRYYYFVIFIFCIGAGMGAVLSELWGVYSIWADALVIFLGFLMMFRKESPIKGRK